jgi:hypothetical protein
LSPAGIEQVPRTQRADMGTEMDHMVIEEAGEGTRSWIPLTRVERTTQEVGRRQAEEAGWMDRLRPNLNVLQEMGELTVPVNMEEAGWIDRLRPDLNMMQEIGEMKVPVVEVKECINMEEGEDEIREPRNEDYHRLGLNERATIQPTMILPKLHQFPMNTRRIVGYRHSRNEWSQDQSRIGRNEVEVKIQESSVYIGTTRLERHVYVGMTSIGENVGVRWGEHRRVNVRDQVEMRNRWK